MAYNALVHQPGGNISFSTQSGSDLAIYGGMQAVSLASKALLTGIAMDNVTALSAMENYLSQTVPSAANRIKFLVDTYTVTAADLIRR